MSLIRLYNEPSPDIIDQYTKADDGFWYPKTQRDETVEVTQYIPTTSPADIRGPDWKGIDGKHMNEGVKANMTPVGDVNSDEKGSGARMLGDDKDPLQWIPVRNWLDYFMSICFECQRETGMDSVEIGQLLSHIQCLSEFQEGKANGRELTRNLGPLLMVEACRVFEYGSHKYKAWNWMKGMSWSVVVGCALRHAKAIFEGELLDQESGLPHSGHFACNLIMLGTYYWMYPEGNDFPKEEWFE